MLAFFKEKVENNLLVKKQLGFVGGWVEEWFSKDFKTSL